jgi:RNA polymerase sigma-70 factor (ECF subfamily)
MEGEPLLPVSDIALWQAFKHGDKLAFNNLYQRYVRILYNYGIHFISDEDLVQDAVQELFIDLWRLRSTLADTTSVKFYLFRSLRRKIHLAMDRKTMNVPTTEVDMYENLPSTEDVIIQKERVALDIKKLQHYLTTLPSRQYEVIRLRFFEESSWSEIADIMEIDEQSVRNLVGRAVAKLRQLYGFVIAAVLLFK